VIVATERAKRPRDFIKAAKDKKELPEYKQDCPFCPGNEDKTPEETLRISDGKGWKVRSVFNLFGALSPKAASERKNDGIYRGMAGIGNHEVIIEHPKHDIIIPLMKDSEVADIIKVYKERYISIQQQKGIEAIVIFKNHGPGAGTSLEHPHSQLIATPIVPPQIRNRIRQAMGYFDITGECIFCRTLAEEIRLKVRVVLETEQFCSFMPYASVSPFQTWIFPRRHTASFADASEEEVLDLAKHLRIVLSKLYHGLDNPDYNYTIRSMPVNEKGTEYFHWYISIIPRISQPAGFELGSGMFINTALPEESAQFLRQVEVSK